MIPNKKRAQRLDDRLRVLGFHARASGMFKATVSASPVSKAPGIVSSASAKNTRATKKLTRNGGDEPGSGGEGRRGGSAGGSRPLTQEEKQESMAKMVEACKKRRPGTEGGESDGIGRRYDGRFDYFFPVRCLE